MGEQLRQYTIEVGDTLHGIAESHRLAGWMALYFAPCNQAFRVQYPNPFRLPVGATLSIPETAGEQHAVLGQLLEWFQSVKRKLPPLRSAQLEWLRSHELRLCRLAGDDRSPDNLTALVRDLAASTHQAIGLLKLADQGMSAANLQLAREALLQHRLDSQHDASLMLNLTARAANEVVWVVGESEARVWCDLGVRSSWARPVLDMLRTDPTQPPSASALCVLIGKLKSNLLFAADGVMKSLDVTIDGVSYELKNLVRLEAEEADEAAPEGDTP